MDSNNATTLAGATGASSIQGIVYYPFVPYFLIILFLLVVGSFQWTAFLYAKYRTHRRIIRDEESVRSCQKRSSLFSLPLAVVNFYRILAFRTTIGFRSYKLSLVELFVTAAYVVVLLVWTFIIKDTPDDEPLNWSSRAGLLVASQFPFVTILGTKNNIISLVTRISADKLNIIHRIVARACFIFIIMHVIGGGNNFSFYATPSNDFANFGIVAASAFGVLVVISLRPVRERVYELFFYVHLVAVIVIMIAAILHINLFGAPNFIHYIWPSFVFWAVDRLIRSGRLFYFNRVHFSCSRRQAMLDATTEVLSDSLVRVRFRRPDYFHWSPGQFAYLVMPTVSRLPFEAHPFSIASVDSLLFAPDAKAAEDSSGKELVFLIRIKDGFTRRLKDIAARRERVKVYVDGPYGEQVNLRSYNTSLLIAGGTGITFALPALLSVIESVRIGSSCCRRVVLVWSIRDADFLNGVSESLTKAIRFTPPGLRVDIRVFLTRSNPQLPSVGMERRSNFEAILSNQSDGPSLPVPPPNSSDKSEKSTLSQQPWLKITSGRPNLGHIIHEEVNAASGSVYVGVCGPNAMAKVVREALRLPWSRKSCPMNGGPSVTLHVETFGYA